MLSKKTIELAIEAVRSKYAVDLGMAKIENMSLQQQWYRKSLVKMDKATLAELEAELKKMEVEDE